MRFGIQTVPQSPVKDYVDKVVAAEKLGFDFCWVADIGLHADTFMSCAAAAEKTTRIKIGPGVVNPYSRHPALIAAQAATLQDISKGRAFLGLGIGGFRALQQLGIPTWRNAGETLRESIEICRRLLDGENLTFKGKIFETSGAMIPGAKTRARVPIYLGVMLGKTGIRLSGELCDGAIIVGPLGKMGLRTVIEGIRTAARNAGKGASSMEIAMSCPLSVARNSKEAVSSARIHVARMAILDKRLSPVLRKEGITEEERMAVRTAVDQGLPLEKVVTDEMVELFDIAGTPSECVEKIAQVEKEGVTQLAVGRPACDVKEMIDLLSKEVMPHFRSDLY